MQLTLRGCFDLHKDCHFIESEVAFSLEGIDLGNWETTKGLPLPQASITVTSPNLSS